MLYTFRIDPVVNIASPAWSRSTSPVVRSSTRRPHELWAYRGFDAVCSMAAVRLDGTGSVPAFIESTAPTKSRLRG